jgi:hypothetical protein
MVRRSEGLLSHWVSAAVDVLDDPFSAATLVLRIPTLTHRFVQRLRRRPKGASFQTLEHTMTLQGALKLLEIPAELGRRVRLAQIREAYQGLKELYRQPVGAGGEQGGQGPRLH